MVASICVEVDQILNHRRMLVLVGHISLDGTAIEGREKPARKEQTVATQPQKKRGSQKQGELRETKLSKIEQQQGKPLMELFKELPSACDYGTKSNPQGYKNSWDGYKLHLDTADCDIPVSAY